ncbi:unnamed protein product [Schistosoma bovis]|nr:unnamed protein product [Schistosoma bovis]
MHPTPPNDRRRRVILLARNSRQYSYYWTAEVSVTSANAAASVTGVFITQFATIIMICLSVRRDRAKKVPVRADFFSNMRDNETQSHHGVLDTWLQSSDNRIRTYKYFSMVPSLVASH